MGVYRRRKVNKPQNRRVNKPVNKPKKKAAKHTGAIVLRDRTKNKPVRSRPVGQGNLTIIKRAMKNHQVLSFDYTSVKGEQTHRSVEVYKIERDRTGDPVLWGWCLEADAIRKFKIAGISDPEVSNFNFKPRFPVEDLL